jgi:hypothetical protein
MNKNIGKSISNGVQYVTPDSTKQLRKCNTPNATAKTD